MELQSGAKIATNAGAQSIRISYTSSKRVKYMHHTLEINIATILQTHDFCGIVYEFIK